MNYSLVLLWVSLAVSFSCIIYVTTKSLSKKSEKVEAVYTPDRQQVLDISLAMGDAVTDLYNYIIKERYELIEFSKKENFNREEYKIKWEETERFIKVIEKLRGQEKLVWEMYKKIGR